MNKLLLTKAICGDISGRPLKRKTVTALMYMLGLISYPKFLCVIISYLLIILSFIFHLYRLSSLDLLVVLTCAFWVLQGKLNKTSFCHYQLTITGPLVTITGNIQTIPYGTQPIYTYIYKYIYINIYLYD